MRIDVLTLFPEMFEAVVGRSILGRASEAGLIQINLVNFRDYTHDRHRTVDDTPYGGGSGMLLKPEPVFEAVDAICAESKPEPESGSESELGSGSPYIILTCPGGTPFTQEKARELAAKEHLVIICGHYEGFDERVREGLVDEALSIGDFVLTGGELPAMVVIDAVARLIPGVLAEGSVDEESFNDGLLEYPQYTRPPEYRGMAVPEVLLSGDHGRIAKWRREQSIRRTFALRPDLLSKAELSREEKELIMRLESSREEE